MRTGKSRSEPHAWESSAEHKKIEADHTIPDTHFLEGFGSTDTDTLDLGVSDYEWAFIDVDLVTQEFRNTFGQL